MKIKYKTTKISILMEMYLTDCPHGEKSKKQFKGAIIRVGSPACRKCQYFEKKDNNNVWCKR